MVRIWRQFGYEWFEWKSVFRVCGLVGESLCLLSIHMSPKNRAVAAAACRNSILHPPLPKSPHCITVSLRSSDRVIFETSAIEYFHRLLLAAGNRSMRCSSHVRILFNLTWTPFWLLVSKSSWNRQIRLERISVIWWTRVDSCWLDYLHFEINLMISVS
jgi:hypothetical protein